MFHARLDVSRRCSTFCPNPDSLFMGITTKKSGCGAFRGRVSLQSPKTNRGKVAFCGILVSPSTSLTSKAGKFAEPTRKRTRPNGNSLKKECTSLYLGENFAVKLDKVFKFSTLIQNNIEWGVVQTNFDPLRKVDQMSLSMASQRLQDTPNAGGNSVMSEVLSFEMLQRCFNASLLKTEMEVEYFPEGGSITDYTCSIFNTTVGVSVTRAMKFKGQYELEDAQNLLRKKLRGINQSNRNTLEKWSKQILHVWATSKHVANIVTMAMDLLDPSLLSNTVILVTEAQTTPEIFANK